ncbi:LysR family transcriptional regulator substrate-binding protein [Orlajensenia leifsoniae]|uniref:LysR family transcriptional regulator n=1 Tax=Orlajensenia leifsoniae TaxID=2561933 RepID=A0A4Y9R8L4_9MICO|nr:LysR family transcriptional regulator substrate-binding protein [Leifsonia flava]TFW00153.1 LysR family transcriptional regulator [Leifsonia flava]
MLKLAFVAGVTPTKWLRAWNDRHPRDPLEAFRTEPAEQTAVLRDQRADLAIARLPVDDDTGLSVIRLYDEVAVAVAPKDHAIAAADELTLADIADEKRVDDIDAMDGDMVMELVAAGVGIVVVPHSIARLYARKDVISRTVTDAPVTQIALVWPTAATTPDVEEFIGIVRGRTSNSSRGSSGEQAAEAKKAAEAKAKAAKAKKKAAQPAKKQRTAAEIRVAAARNSRGKKRRN